MSKQPKGCSVKWVEIESKGAEASYECGGEAGQGRGTFPLPRGSGWSNYPKAWFPKVRAVNFRGARVSGIGSHISFEYYGATTCKVSRSGAFKELNCTTKGGNGELHGQRKRRR
jgi:hypothetical protein